MKARLRMQIKEIVSAMSPQIARVKSQTACESVLALPEYRDARTIMLYLPMPAEADCSGIAKHAWSSGKTVLAPKITWQPREMIAVQIRSLDTDVTSGEYGIPMPAGDEPWPADKINFVIVPALAFDRRGHRLGRGGGFYDRFLAQGALRAAVCGLGFSEQIVDRLPNHPHDQPMEILVTDREILRFSHVPERAGNGPRRATAGKETE